MLVKTITTDLKIPYNFFKSDQICIRTLNQISNKIFIESNMNPKITMGGKRRTHLVSKKTNRNKTKKRYIKGGSRSMIHTGSALFFLLIIFLAFNPLTIDSLMPIKDSDVIKKLIYAGKNALVFKNTKGTCASNILYFLNIIPLEMHQHNVLNTVKMTDIDMTNKIYANATVKTTWIKFSLFDALDQYIPESADKDKNIYDYFENANKSELAKRYIEKLQQLCSTIGYEPGFITILSYPIKSVHHVVVLWYTETRNIVLIDLQLFEMYNRIEIYSDANADYEKYNAGKGIKVYPLSKYIKDNMAFDDIHKNSQLLKEKHFSIVDDDAFKSVITDVE